MNVYAIYYLNHTSIIVYKSMLHLPTTLSRFIPEQVSYLPVMLCISVILVGFVVDEFMPIDSHQPIVKNQSSHSYESKSMDGKRIRWGETETKYISADDYLYSRDIIRKVLPPILRIR